MERCDGHGEGVKGCDGVKVRVWGGVTVVRKCESHQGGVYLER